MSSVFTTIFELGELRVFTTDLIMKPGDPYQNVFWCKKGAEFAYGPFTSVHDAMANYTFTIATQKPEKEEKLAPVIYVDFKNKRRIVYAPKA